MGFNNMMHAMHEYQAQIIITGKHLLASWGKKKEKTRRREKRKKKFMRLPARVLNSRPSRFPIQYTNALSKLNT